MQRHTFQIIGKISILSLIIVACIQAVTFATGSAKNNDLREKNELTYQSASEQNIANVAVAIGTGVGVRFENTNLGEVTSYTNTAKVWQNSEESKSIRQEMISKNMIIIKEYLWLVKTDTLELLENATNRRTTLNTFISQLELRFKNAATSYASLQNHKDLLIAELRNIESKTDTVKTKISASFSSNDASSTIENVDEYLELQRQYKEHFTDVVFINQFLAQYSFLNNYNKVLLDTLINNKEALINKSFVVIPDSDDRLLKEFNLLYEEKEFKALTQ